MEMTDGIKQNTPLQMPICRQQVYTDLSTEVSLPDYLPEVKRLLRVTATVLPAAPYVGSSGADFSGRVEYRILYAGNDSGLYCVDAAEDYAFRIPFEIPADFLGGEGFACVCRPLAESVSGRVTAPRKLSVKGRLKSDATVLGMQIPEENFPQNRPTEKLMGRAASARRFFGTAEPLHLADEVIYDGTRGELRVICADAAVLLTEVTAGSGCVNVRGEIALKLLSCLDGADGVPTAENRRIPFACSIPVDGAEVNCRAVATGVCSEIAVTVEEGKITVEVTLCLSAEANRNDSFDYVRDAFSPGFCSACEVGKQHLQECRQAGNGNFSVNTSGLFSDVGIPAGATLADADFVPRLTDWEQSNGRVTLTGNARVSLLYFDGGEPGVREFDLPIRYEVEGQKENASLFDAFAERVICKVRSDGEKWMLDGEIAVAYTFFAESDVQRLTALTVGDASPRDPASLTVFYPADGESLWDVAKKFLVPVEALVRGNKLPDAPRADVPASLDGVPFLLV